LKGAFVSVGVRMLVNVEALNMVESVGNVTRHRRATVVYRRDKEYVIRIVPALSGENIAHAYQQWIAELAKHRYPADKIPLCEFCEKSEFLKHCDLNLFGSKDWERGLVRLIEGKNYNPHEIEKEIVRNCVVEDLGGFLYPGDPPVKRTSRFQVSYMIPTIESLDAGAVALEPQFHVRHSPTRTAKEGQKVAGQAIYYVETGSAVYSLTFNLDVGGIGMTSMLKVEQAVDEEERKNRINLAIDALSIMLDSKIFGAKLSRFTPVIDYETIIAAVSSYPPFTISSPAVANFPASTARRGAIHSNLFSSNVQLFGYGEGLVNGIERAETVLTLFDAVKKALLARL
jgi:CRISPR-associated protein Csa2